MAKQKRKLKNSKKGNRRKKSRRTDQDNSENLKMIENNYPPADSLNSTSSPHPLKLFVDYNHNTVSEKLKELHKDVIWCKHHNFFHPKIVQQVKLYEAGIAVDDVIQGILNDCWLLGPLATLTRQHRIIQRLIDAKGIDVPNQVEISFWQVGRKKSVIVDDYFPCVPTRRSKDCNKCSCNNDVVCSCRAPFSLEVEVHSNDLYGDFEPIYCKPNGPELWALYIEKGYATLHGSYQALHYGQDYEAMIDLTGSPSYSYSIQPQPSSSMNAAIKNFEVLEELVGYSGFITAISYSQAEDGTPIHQEQSLRGIGEHLLESTKNAEGIFPRHSYSVLNTLRLPSIDSNLQEECFQLIKLRNPHGKHEFNGRWSDRCRYWENENCQKALRDIGETIIDKDEGIFWMDFENFRKYFARVNACFPKGVSTSKDCCLPWTSQETLELEGPVTSTSSSVSYKYQLTVPDNRVSNVLVFGLHQTDLRPFLRNDYSELTLTVESENQSTNPQIKKGQHRQVQTDIFVFDSGCYWITADIKCDASCINRTDRKYALTIHSTCDYSISSMTEPQLSV